MSIFKNQSGIINIEEFDYLQISIVGMGSIGSFLSLALHKLGLGKIMIIDNDMVEKHNITTQFFFKRHIGQSKVSAIESQLDGEIQKYEQKVQSNHEIKADIVFLCVDSLKQRKIIMKSILDSYEKYKRPKLIIDGRMHKLVFRVLTVDLTKPDILEQYVDGMFGKEFVGTCTEKGIIQNV